MPSVKVAATIKIMPNACLFGNLSATFPPIMLPMLIPASTTPITLVHEYKEVDIIGARMRPATISIISVQALARNTMM